MSTSHVLCSLSVIFHCAVSTSSDILLSSADTYFVKFISSRQVAEKKKPGRPWPCVAMMSTGGKHPKAWAAKKRAYVIFTSLPADHWHGRASVTVEESTARATSRALPRPRVQPRGSSRLSSLSARTHVLFRFPPVLQSCVLYI